MASSKYWQIPQLHTEDEGQERRVSWLELFHDLVYVVVIAEVTHYLSAHLTLSGVLGYILLFLALWWAWIGGTFYNERFETNDLSYRLFTFSQMIPVAAMAIFAHDALGNTSVQFGLSYALARLLVLFMWARAGYHEPRFRPISNRYLIGFTLSIALFVISAFVPIPLRFGLWFFGLLIDLATPVFTANQQGNLPRFSTSKLPERFGLFIMIVLGEAVVSVISGVAAQEQLTGLIGFDLVLGLATTFGLWWVYFDFIARRVPRAGFWWAFGWNYLHLPLALSIAALSAGVLNLLNEKREQIEVISYGLVGWSLALALLAIAMIELTVSPGKREPADPRVSVPLKIAAALLALVITPFGRELGPTFFLASMLPLLLVQMIYGAYVWYTYGPPAAEIAEGEAI